MNELQTFTSAAFGSVRIIDKAGQPWFVGKDVAVALGYSNPQKAIREHVRDAHKGVNEMDTPGGKQQLAIIDEAGLYSLVMRAKTEKAEAFQEWVTGEVLPAIRKHGGYLIKRQGADYNSPTQRSMELGLFRVKETPIIHADGHVTVNKTVKVTPKAQIYFANKFLGGKCSEGFE